MIFLARMVLALSSSASGKPRSERTLVVPWPFALLAMLQSLSCKTERGNSLRQPDRLRCLPVGLHREVEVLRIGALLAGGVHLVAAGGEFDQHPGAVALR